MQLSKFKEQYKYCAANEKKLLRRIDDYKRYRRAKYKKKMKMMKIRANKLNASTPSTATNRIDLNGPFIRENQTMIADDSTPQKQHTTQRHVDLTYLPSVRSDGSASMTLSNSST